MNAQLFQALASQRVAERRTEAVARWRHQSGVEPHRASLRARAGWTLIGVGLRLAVQSGGSRPASPRPSGA